MESVEMDGIDMSVIVLLLASSAALVKEVSYCFILAIIRLFIFTITAFPAVTWVYFLKTSKMPTLCFIGNMEIFLPLTAHGP